MEFFAKLLALVKPKPTLIAPPSQYADDEFLEVVARQWRERYQGQLPQSPAGRTPEQARAAA